MAESKIVLKAEGSEQAAAQIKRIQDAFEAAEKSAVEFQKATVTPGTAIPPVPAQAPQPQVPQPQTQVPQQARLRPVTPTAPPRWHQSWAGEAAQLMQNTAGSLGGRRSNLLSMAGQLPKVGGMFAAMGGPVGLAILGGTVAVAGALKVVNELAENEMERVQETFASGMAQRLGAMGDSVRDTIIDEERRGTPTGMLRSFLGAYSQSGGSLDALQTPYLTAQHPDRQQVTEQSILNQITDLMTVFGVEGGVLGQLAGRLAHEGVDPSRLFSETNTEIAMRTHGESRATEFYANIQKILEKQLETGAEIGQTTIDKIIGLQAALAAGGMSADALNATIQAVAQTQSSSLDSPSQVYRMLMLRREGESVFDTQLRMETQEGTQTFLEGHVQRTRHNEEYGIRTLAKELGISLHQAQGLYRGVMSRMDQAQEAQAEQLTILDRERDTTRIDPNDPMAVNAALLGIDPETAQRRIQERAALQAEDIRTIGASQMSLLQPLEEKALDVSTWTHEQIGNALGVTQPRSVAGGRLSVNASAPDMSLLRSKSAAMGLLQTHSRSRLGLGGDLASGVFYNPELSIWQEEKPYTEEEESQIGIPPFGAGPPPPMNLQPAPKPVPVPVVQPVPRTVPAPRMAPSPIPLPAPSPAPVLAPEPAPVEESIKQPVLENLEPKPVIVPVQFQIPPLDLEERMPAIDPLIIPIEWKGMEGLKELKQEATDTLGIFGQIGERLTALVPTRDRPDVGVGETLGVFGQVGEGIKNIASNFIRNPQEVRDVIIQDYGNLIIAASIAAAAAVLPAAIPAITPAIAKVGVGAGLGLAGAATAFSEPQDTAPFPTLDTIPIPKYNQDDTNTKMKESTDLLRQAVGLLEGLFAPLFGIERKTGQVVTNTENKGFPVDD